jgi:hypothetical protein
MMQYQKDTSLIGKLTFELRILEGKAPSVLNQKEINNRKKLIKEAHNRLAINPSTKLIDAGLAPSIVDDINTDTITSPFPTLFEQIGDKVTKRIPEPIKKVGRVVFITESTSMYKMLNNAVKMTDFIARGALYDYYTSPDRGTKKMTHKQAAEKVMDEFINFDVPTHRTTEYLNAIGIMWFTKYAFRILSVIANTVKDNPYKTLSTFAITSLFNTSNIILSTPIIFKDMSNLFLPITGFTPETIITNTVDALLNIAE